MKKSQKGGVYRGKKDKEVEFSEKDRGGILPKKTTNKLLKEFAKAKTYITNVAKKGVLKLNNKINQTGGIVRPYRKSWGNSLGRNVDKIYF